MCGRQWVGSMAKRGGKKSKELSAFWILIPLYIGLAALFALLIRAGHVQLLDPAGYIAGIQSHILWIAITCIGIASSIIIISVFAVVFRYREDAGRRYDPAWTPGKRLLLAGWGIPSVAVAILSVMIWNTAQAVDPYRPISSNAPPVTIQVVALRWKWLFLYPNDNIATVNMMEIPVGTPISLRLTADAPMNSFWIPQLSGQTYAMTGMVTQLHIEADKPGDYAGSPAEISGDGFAGMDFTVHAVTASDYAAWKALAGEGSQPLDYAAYKRLAEPSSYVPPALYALADPNLFDAIVMQFMAPGTVPPTSPINGSNH